MRRCSSSLLLLVLLLAGPACRFDGSGVGVIGPVPPVDTGGWDLPLDRGVTLPPDTVPHPPPDVWQPPPPRDTVPHSPPDVWQPPPPPDLGPPPPSDLGPPPTTEQRCNGAYQTVPGYFLCNHGPGLCRFYTGSTGPAQTCAAICLQGGGACGQACEEGGTGFCSCDKTASCADPAIDHICTCNLP